MKKQAAICALFIVVWCGHAVSGPRISSYRLPLVVIGYVYKIAEDVPRAIQSSGSLKLSENEFYDILGPELSILDKNLEQLPGGIRTRMAFVKYVFISQVNIPGHISGFPRRKGEPFEKSKIPLESILFVTTSLKSLGDRVLVILSNVSPERTSIFTVDTGYNVELLFDSALKNNLRNTTIGSIHSVRVAAPGNFLLEERPGRIWPEPRSFSLSTFEGKFQLGLLEGDSR